MRIPVRLIAAGLGGGVVLCGALVLQCTNGDSPFPALGPDSGLLLTPCEVVLPVVAGTGDAGSEGGAGVAPSTTIVIQGRSLDGLGADSVGVTVSVGSCAGSCGFDAGLACPQQMASAVKAGPTEWSRIQLSSIADGGCTQNSVQSLSCSLSPDGIARFTLGAALPVVSTEGQYVPVCVCPVPSTQSVEIPVLIAEALDGGALGLQSQDAAILPQTIQAQTCGPRPLVNCALPLRSLPVTVQLLQNDAGQIAQQPLELVLSVTPAASGLWLSTDDCKSGTASQPGSISVEMASGTSEQTLAYVCVDEEQAHYGATYVLNARAASQTNLTQATQSVFVAAQPAQVAFTPGAASDGGIIYTATVFDCQGAPLIGPTVSAAGPGVEGVTGGDGGTVSFFVPTASDAGVPVQVTFGASNCTQTLGGGS